MPLSFAEELWKDFDKIKWMSEQEKKAPRRKSRRVGKSPAYGSLFALRNTRITIREGALRKVQIILTYKKVTTGETKKYVVAPYSYRYRRLKAGYRRLLFAYDMEEKKIKGYVIGNVRNVALTDRKFVPKWPVEIA